MKNRFFAYSGFLLGALISTLSNGNGVEYLTFVIGCILCIEFIFQGLEK